MSQQKDGAERDTKRKQPDSSLESPSGKREKNTSEEQSGATKTVVDGKKADEIFGDEYVIRVSPPNYEDEEDGEEDENDSNIFKTFSVPGEVSIRQFVEEVYNVLEFPFVESYCLELPNGVVLDSAYKNEPPQTVGTLYFGDEPVSKFVNHFNDGPLTLIHNFENEGSVYLTLSLVQKNSSGAEANGHSTKDNNKNVTTTTNPPQRGVLIMSEEGDFPTFEEIQHGTDFDDEDDEEGEFEPGEEDDDEEEEDENAAEFEGAEGHEDDEADEDEDDEEGEEEQPHPSQRPPKKGK